VWLITDNIREIEALGPWPFLPVQASGEPPWRHQVPLPKDLSALWRAASGGEFYWVLECPGDQWHSIMIVGEASASQFDGLQLALRELGQVPGPVACLVLQSRACHGQHGRPWQAIRGNLHLSVAITPPASPLPLFEILPAVTIVPAVAAADAISSASQGRLEPRVKWVNDVVLGPAKVAGVLSATQIMGETLEAMIFGIGLNVAATPDVAPTPFVPSATSLAAALAGLPSPLPVPSLGEVCWHTLDALMAAVRLWGSGGPAALVDRYRALSMLTGRAVEVWPDHLDSTGDCHTPLAQGTVAGIDADLSLRLVGVAQPIRRGRLALRS
jgi:BirA family biotin operon repressor/biotin-[acetyl-CoA-carboxylase] ligase